MLNQILVKCRIKDIKKYLGQQLQATVNGREVKVYLRLLCDEIDIMDGLELSDKYDNIVMLDYIGDDFSPVYMNLTERTTGKSCVIRIIDIEDELNETVIKNHLSMIPNGVTPVFKVKSNYADLETLYKLNQIYPKIRFCGGTLFAIKGCNIGCCGIPLLEEKGIKYDLDAYYRKGLCNCALEVHDFSDLRNIKVVEIEQPSDIVTDVKEEAEKTQIQFSDLFGGVL